MMGSNPDPHRKSLNKMSDNLLAELIEDEISWHNIEIIGRGLVILAGDAFNEQIKQRQKYIRNKYKEG